MTSSTREEMTQLGIPILRSTRPELAKDFYNAVIGKETLVLGTERDRASDQTSGIAVPTPEGTPSRWFPHAISGDLDAVKDAVRDLGGTYHRESTLFQNLVVTAPDRSEIIVTERGGDDHPADMLGASTSPRLMLELCTREIEASSTFYTGILGLEEVPVPDDPYSYRVYFAGDIGIAGAVDMTTLFRESTESHWIPYFHVHDVRIALQDAVAYGARVTVPINDSMFDTPYAILTDPTGATFGLRELPTGGVFGRFSREHRGFVTEAEAAERA